VVKTMALSELIQ